MLLIGTTTQHIAQLLSVLLHKIMRFVRRTLLDSTSFFNVNNVFHL